MQANDAFSRGFPRPFIRQFSPFGRGITLHFPGLISGFENACSLGLLLSRGMSSLTVPSAQSSQTLDPDALLGFWGVHFDMPMDM